MQRTAGGTAAVHHTVKKKKKSGMSKGTAIRLAVIAALVLLLIITIIVIAASNKVKVLKYYEIEAGSEEEISPSWFLKKQVAGAEISADSVYDIHKVGEYKIGIVCKKKTYYSTLRVVDTVAPSASTHSLLVSLGSSLAPEDLIDEIYDETEVKAVFGDPAPTDTLGTKTTTIILTDEGGNTSTYNASYTVIESVNVVSWEIGSELPTIEEFIPNSNARFTEDPASLEIKKPGVYYIGVVLDGFNYKVTLVAEDTIAPTASAAEGISIMKGSPIPAIETLITDIFDQTEVTLAFKDTYTSENPGILSVIVILTDEGGNQTEVLVPIAVKVENSSDVTPPVITLNPDYIEIGVGDSIPYTQYVSIVDDFDGAIDIYDETRVSIDKTTLNAYLSGTYYVMITAVDSFGNSSSAKLTVRVKDLVVTDEMTYALADKVLKKIIIPGMTREEQIKTVWEYCRSTDHMLYTDVSNKSNSYITEAYYAFSFHRGDCYTYYSMAAVLYDRLNIPYYTVQRVAGARTRHWWLLVDFGDGWYHVDPCYHSPRFTRKHSDGSTYYTFKLTDAELVEFTSFLDQFYVNWKYYVFDKSAYPRTPVLNHNGTYSYSPYTVSYTAQSGGRIDGTATQSVYHGKTSSAVTAVAGAGYKFVAWSDGNTNPTRSDTVYTNTKYEAVFARDGSVTVFTLKYTAGTGGRISGEASQEVVGGTYGTKVTAVAYEGYKFIRWSDGETAASRTDLADADLSVNAIFAKQDAPADEIIVTYAAEEGGSITGSAVQMIAAGESTSTVTALANEGWHFVSWSDGKTDASRSDSPSNSITYTAIFESDDPAIPEYTVTYAAAEGGSISGETSQRVEDGEKTNAVTAVANAGWHFVRWDDGVTNPTRSDYPKADVKYTAIFEEGEAPAQYTVTYAASEGGSISGEKTQTRASGTSTSAVTALANEGWHFVGWDDGNTNPTRSDTVSASVTYTAIFESDEAQ